jgi:hypothetical protein
MAKKFNGCNYPITAFNGMFLDDGFSVVLLTNGRVNEGTLLLNLGQQIIQGICTSSGTAANCWAIPWIEKTRDSWVPCG